MTATAQNPEAEFSAFGRRRLCLVCKGPLRHPHTGRPRVVCRKGECFREYHRRKKAEAKEEKASRWMEADLSDAVRMWGGCYCGCNRLPYRFQWEFPPLPRCQLCWKAPISDQQARWLSNCKPGCPLPNPFATGAAR